MSPLQILLIAGATLIAAVAAGLVTNAIAAQIRRLTPTGRHRATAAAVVIAVAAGGLVAIEQGVPVRDESAAAPQSSSQHTSTAWSPEVSPSFRPTQPGTVTPEAAASASPSTDGGIDHFVVGTGNATPAVPCCRVGPNVFQLQQDGKTAFGYNWSARTADNTIVDSNDCAIVVTITGPEDVPGIRKSNCTVTGSNGFSNFGNIASVSTAGTYTITVRDDVSGATGSVAVKVVH